MKLCGILLLIFVANIKSDIFELGGGRVFSSFYGYDHVPTVLPEIIVNRAVRPLDPRSNRAGYVYEKPSTLPPSNDEYLPPPAFDYLPPTTSMEPPRDEPDTSYLPSADKRDPKDLDFFKTTVNTLNGTKVEVRDLKCLQTPDGYYKASIYMHNNVEVTPTIERESGDPRCEIKTLRSQSIVNIVSEDFQKCGIFSCGADLCLKLRFPQIRGLRTGDDLSLTLQCKLPERVVVKTHSIRVGPSSPPSPRNLGAVATGGGQQLFHSRVGLFRKNSENVFTKPLHSGDSVSLGEDILLRAQVRAGDGME